MQNTAANAEPDYLEISYFEVKHLFFLYVYLFYLFIYFFCCYFFPVFLLFMENKKNKIKINKFTQIKIFKGCLWK